MEKKIQISESKIRQITERVTNDFITTLPDVSNVKEGELITEMARLNKNDTGLFPYNKFDVKIWSNDHEPPHFHVECDGWDISCLIESGEVYRINAEGRKGSVGSYIQKTAPLWLENPCASTPKLKNREMAQVVWDALH